MKKLIITIGLIYISLTACAQSSIYVTFSSVNNSATGIVHRKVADYNTDLYRSAPHIFTIQNPKLKYYFKFTYMDVIGAPSNYILGVTPSQFSQYKSIDWDAIAPTLTNEQAKEKVEYILSHDKIYFIDKRDSKASYVVAVPVKQMKANY